MKFKQYLSESNGKTSIESILLTLYKECLPYIKDTLNKRRRTTFDIFMYSGRSSNKDIFTGKVRKDRMPKDSDQRVHDLLDQEFYYQFGWHARSNVLFTSGNYQQAKNYGKVYMIFPKGRYKSIYNPKYSDVIDYMPEDTWENEVSEVLSNKKPDEDEALYQYNNSYGEGEGGTWWYDGEDTEREAPFDALEYIINNYDEFGFDTQEDAEDERDDITNDMNWVPDMSWYDFWSDFREEYFENIRDNIEDEVKENIRYICNEYVRMCEDNNIVDAIDSNNEIMLNCNEYIAINYDKYHKVLTEIFKEGYMEPTEIKLRSWYEKQGKRFPKQMNMWASK